jgi:hypothetical protein
MNMLESWFKARSLRGAERPWCRSAGTATGIAARVASRHEGQRQRNPSTGGFK